MSTDLLRASRGRTARFRRGMKAIVASASYGLALISTTTINADPPFTEEAIARGVNYEPDFGGTAGNGVMFADLDNDGDPDLVAIGNDSGTIGLWENDGTGNFTSRTNGSGLPNLPPTSSSGITAADYDNDGDLDLYFANFGPNILMRNNGNFSFTNVSALSGLNDPGNATGCGWADYNLDGYLDVYVGNLDYGTQPRPNGLYKNLGNGTFVNVAAELGVDNFDPAWHAMFVDIDRDGDADIYVSNDKGIYGCDNDESRNYLYRNDGGTFTDVTFETGTQACADSMGVAVGDFDRNGYIDLYCANIPEGNPTLMQQPDGTFLEQGDKLGIAAYEFGWGAMFFDYDNDANLDLYLCNFLDRNMLFRNTGTWPCQNVAVSMHVAGPQFSLSYAVASADVDGDGDLDILAQENGEKLYLYINHSGELRNALRLDVRRPLGHGHALGALVDVRTSDIWQLREVTAGSNYKSQNELMVHVGLNDAVVADEVIVTWPGGDTRTLTNLPANDRWTVWHTNQVGDVDNNGVRDLTDFHAFASCYEMTFTPGCEQMDHDGDSDVDVDDFDLFLASYSGPDGDCNDNGVSDLFDILSGALEDLDGDGIPDSCEHSLCDLNSDGTVDVRDLLQLLAAWGACDACIEDLNGDAAVGMFELQLLLEHWD